jgi:arginase
MNKTIDLIAAPYDSAHYNKRMGAGPLHLVDNGLIEHLSDEGFKVNYKLLVVEEELPAEIASTIQLLTKVKHAIIQSKENASFPIVLSGNCCASVGVGAALKDDNVGVAWFDAHGDCETPGTTYSGFLDGMGLSMLLFSSWQNLLSSFDLRSAIAGRNVALIGARDLSTHEKKFIASNEISHLTVEQIIQSKESIIEATCSRLSERGVKQLHLHVDVDVLDPSIAPANSYAVSNGLGNADLLKTIELLINKIPVSSLTIASYDPVFDVENKMLDTIIKLIEVVAKRIA